MGNSFVINEELKLGDEILVGPNKYKLINVYLDKRAINSYDKMIGLYSEAYNEVIAALPAKTVTGYLNSLQLEWKLLHTNN